MNFKSKLAQSGTTIFSVMSKLANEHKAINLGQGFPNFDCDDALKALVSKHLNDNKNQYCPMPGLLKLRSVIAEKIDNLYGLNINPETEVTVTAGATQALFTAISAFVHKGDEVVIIEPAYDSYKPSIEINGGVVKSYILSGPDFSIDWEAFEQLISEKTSMIIINTPQNPIGKTLKERDLQALEKIVQDKDIIVLSDEVYEHLIYDQQLHQSVMRFPNLFKQSLAVFSFGKTFHSTGWKIGYIVGPQDLMQEFRNVHQWNVFSVNSFLQYALADYLAMPDSYNTLSSFYQTKRDFLSGLLSESKFRAIPCEGTYFQLYDYSEISNEKDTDFAIKLTADFGVASIPISPFYTDPQNDHLIRLCFAKTEDVLSAAAEKLLRL